MRRLLLSLALLGVLTGGVAAWGVRYGAGYLPSGFVRERIIEAVTQAIGGRGQVQVSQARVRRSEEGQRLFVEDFSITGRDGQVVLVAPRAEIDFDVMKLLFGGDAVRTIALRDLSVRLVMSREGRLSILNEDIGGASAGVVAGKELAQTDVRTVFGALGAALSGQGAMISGLDHFALRNGKLVIDDPTHNTQLIYSNLSVQFAERQQDRREIHIGAERNGRAWSVQARLVADTPQEKEIAVHVDRLPLEDVAYLTRAALDEASAMPFNGDITIALNADGQVSGWRAAMEGKGHARLTGSDSGNALESVMLKADWSARTQTLRVSELSASAGPNGLRISGEAVRDGDIHRIAITDGMLRRALPGAAGGALTLDSITGDAVAAATGEISVTRLRLSGPDIAVDLDGVWPAAREAPAIVNLRAGAFESAFGIALWPRQLAPEAHAYVTSRLEKGRFDSMSMRVTIDPAARAAFVNGSDDGNVHVKLETSARGARLRAIDDFPVLNMEQLSVLVDGSRVVATTPRATIPTTHNTTATVSDLKFDCNCVYENPVATIHFRATGAAEPLFDLFDTPLLKAVNPELEEIDAEAGTVDLAFAIVVPQLAQPKLPDIQIRFAGQLNNLSVTGAVPDQKLTGLNATLNLDATGFALKGQGRIADAPATLDVRRPVRQPGEAAITVTLDDAARAKQNIGTGAALSGPVPVKFTQAFGAAKHKRIRVEADLTRAAVNGLFPGWMKPAGRPGKLSFAMMAGRTRDDVDLSDFLAESAGFSLRGQVTLGKDKRLRSARIAQARMSPGDDMRVDLDRQGSVLKIVARGNHLDVRPFLKGLYEAGGKANNVDPVDHDIDVRANILTGHNGEAITGAEFRMVRRGSELRQFSLSGKIGGADLKGSLQNGKLLLLSGNAGGTLRFIDLYRRMNGGAMTLQSSVDARRQDGELIVQNFALRDEPALRRVTADGPPAAAGEEEKVQRRAIAGGKSDVPFERMRVDFVRSDGRLDIREGLLLGPIVGVTMEGIVDAPRDRVNMTGTYVPAFGLNNALAKIPVVGLFLGGPQTGSLFGVNFKVSGAFSAPTVSVNPLSAVAPGFLRKFFEFRKESLEGARVYRMPDT
ncbi:MAG: hypothetical protein ACRCXM_16060, partial [Beijerinckiaceae bacterium]